MSEVLAIAERPKPPAVAVAGMVKAGLRDLHMQALVQRGLHHIEIAAALGCGSRAVRARLRVLRGMGLV